MCPKLTTERCIQRERVVRKGHKARQAELDIGHGAVGFGVSSAEFWFSVPSLCPRSSL